MRICIVGCGAVGSLFAANLARLADVEVWAFDPWQEHVDAINANGLRLSGREHLLAHPHATSDASKVPACDFGIVATKSIHTREAMRAVAGAFAHGATCSVQNGAGNEEIIAKFVPQVIRGTTLPAGHVIEPGHVSWDNKGPTTLDHSSRNRHRWSALANSPNSVLERECRRSRTMTHAAFSGAK